AHPEAPKQRDVLREAVVAVAGDVAGVAVVSLARGVAERVPDRRTLPVGVRRSLNLVRGRRSAPQEPLGETELVVGGHTGLPPRPHAASLSAETYNLTASAGSCQQNIMSRGPAALDPAGLAGQTVTEPAVSEEAGTASAGTVRLSCSPHRLKE